MMILIALAVYYLFGNAHMAKGYAPPAVHVHPHNQPHRPLASNQDRNTDNPARGCVGVVILQRINLSLSVESLQAVNLRQRLLQILQ